MTIGASIFCAMVAPLTRSSTNNTLRVMIVVVEFTLITVVFFARSRTRRQTARDYAGALICSVLIEKMSLRKMRVRDLFWIGVLMIAVVILFRDSQLNAKREPNLFSLVFNDIVSGGIIFWLVLHTWWSLGCRQFEIRENGVVWKDSRFTSWREFGAWHRGNSPASIWLGFLRPKSNFSFNSGRLSGEFLEGTVVDADFEKVCEFLDNKNLAELQ